MVFQWKINKYPVSAQVAGTVFEDIEKRHGEVDPKVVVDESRPAASPLHDCFEWDDETAAEKYREKQAQSMIQNIVVVEVKDPTGKELEPVRAFVSVSDTNSNTDRKYISVEVAVKDNNYNANVIATALQELRAFEKKYVDIIEFSDLFRAIRAVLQQHVP